MGCGPRSAEARIPTSTTAIAPYIARCMPWRKMGVTSPLVAGLLTAACRLPPNPADVSRVVTMVPHRVMPSELPAVRMVAMKPEATPYCSRGTEPKMKLLFGEWNIPMPSPRSISAPMMGA